MDIHHALIAFAATLGFFLRDSWSASLPVLAAGIGIWFLIFPETLRLLDPGFEMDGEVVLRVIGYGLLLGVIGLFLYFPLLGVTYLAHLQWARPFVGLVTGTIIGARFLFVFVLCALDDRGGNCIEESWTLTGGTALLATLVFSFIDTMFNVGMRLLGTVLPPTFQTAGGLMINTLTLLVVSVITIRWLAVCERLLKERTAPAL